jgi:small neutral amino acid transporter SnatA (MarC family)
MIEWTFIIKTTIALIAIVDPIGCLPLFLSLTGQHKKINKKNVVKMTAITVFIILVTSLFLGDKIFKYVWYQHAKLSNLWWHSFINYGDLYDVR